MIMTREQIEKAAYDYTLNDTGGAKDFYELNAREDIAREAFINGAQWRINSVWHSTKELPENSGYLAVLMDNGFMETMYYSAGIGFHEMHLKGYTSWAYIHDLLPNRKEETDGSC